MMLPKIEALFSCKNIESLYDSW